MEGDATVNLFGVVGVLLEAGVVGELAPAFGNDPVLFNFDGSVDDFELESAEGGELGDRVA